MFSKNIFFLRGNKNGQDKFYCIYKENDYAKLMVDNKEEICIYNLDSIFNCLCDKNGDIYILSKDINNDIILNRKNLDMWERRVIFKNNKTIKNSYFYFDIVNNIPIIIYTLNNNMKNNTASLLYTCFFENRWIEPKLIDNIILNNKIKFNIIDIEKEHKLIFYKSINNTIEAKEIILYPFKLGNSIEYIKNGNYVTDISIFADEDKIHIGYISSNRGKMGVYYKTKTDKVSSVKTIWEGRFVDNIVLYKNNNNVYTMWCTDRGVLKINNNFNSSIKKVLNFSKNIVKCKYRNSNGKGGVLSNECYGLINFKGEVPVFSKESQNFYGRREKSMIEATENKNISNNTLENIDDFNSINNYNENQLNELSKELEKLYNKYSILFSRYVEEKSLLKEEINCMLKKELDYIRDIEFLKKENYQLNNIIEDIVYNDNLIDKNI